MGVLATTAVEIRANTSGFHKDVESGVTGTIKKAAAAIAGIFAAEKIADWAKGAVEGAAALEVQQRRVGIVFGDSSTLVNKFAEEAASGYGQSKIAADGFVASIGQSLVSLGIGQQQAAGLSVGLDKLAANISAMTGKPIDDVMNALQRGTLGATRGLKALGIVITPADVAVQALAMHLVAPTKNTTELAAAQLKMKSTTADLTDAITKYGPKSDEAAKATVAHEKASDALEKAMDGTVPKLTNAQKALATIALEHKRAALASDYFKKHTEDLGESQKILKANLSNVEDELGKKLLPAVSGVVGWLAKLAGAKNVSVAVKIVWEGLKTIGGDIEQAVKEAFEGSTREVHVGGGSPHVVVDPGFITQISAAISAGIASTDWSATGKSIGDAISSAIHIGTGWVDAAVAELSKVVQANEGKIAEVGLVIGLTMISKLLDPAFWADHWQLIGGIVLSAAAVMLPEGKLAEIGVKLVGGLLKPFSFLGLKLADMASEAIIEMASAASLKIGALAPLKIVEWAAKAFAALPGRLTDWISEAIIEMGAAASQKLGGIAPLKVAAWILKSLGSAVNAAVDLGAKIITGLVNKFVGLGTILRTVIATGLVAGIGGAIAGLLGWAAGEGSKVASAIANGIKTAPAKLKGMAGDLIGAIGSILSEVIGYAISVAKNIGESIKDGIVSGTEGLAGALAGKLKSAISSAKDDALGFLQHNSPSKLFRDTVGASIGEGTVVGAAASLDLLGPTLTAKLDALVTQMQSVTAANAPKIADAFKRWATDAKAAFDAEMDGLSAKLAAQLTKATAQIEAWKAKLTPAEILLNTTKAKENMDGLTGAVRTAWDALSALPQQHAQAMEQFMAEAKARLDELKASAQQTADDALLAGNKFQKDQTATGADPLAGNLIDAQKNFDQVKALHDQGLASDAEFIAAADALDKARTDAADDENATRLLDEYNAWQAALAQNASANDAITKQQIDDAAAKAALQAGFDADNLAAKKTYDDAVLALTDQNLADEATKQRAHRDADATGQQAYLNKLNKQLTTALTKTKKAWDTHFDKLEKNATKSGGNIVDNLTGALNDASDPGQPLEKALIKVANLIKKYLKTSSPSELGPLSDLDTWWKSLAPTLIKSLDTSMVKGALTDAVTPNPALASVGPGSSAQPQRKLSLDDADILKRLDDLIDAVRGGSKTPAAVTPISIVNKGGVESAVYGAKR